MKLTIPELSLVVLVGASGSGKSTFAQAHFKPTEVLSSDAMRGLLSDDENDQAVTPLAFETLHFIAAKRLALGKLTVVDATNVQPEARKPLIALAREYHAVPVAIVFNLSEKLCIERNQQRPDRTFGPHVVRRHVQDLRRSLRHLRDEGFRHVYVLDTPAAVAAAYLTREPLYTNRKHEQGPFDIIGDVHGCYDELIALLKKLGYETPKSQAPNSNIPSSESQALSPESATQSPIDDPLTPNVTNSEPQVQNAESSAFNRQSAISNDQSPTPPPRKLIFLGDLVDRGPRVVEVLRLVMQLVERGQAFCVPGNHDMKLLRKLQGRDVQITHGLAETLAQLERETPAFREQVKKFLDSLISHFVLDDGKLVVAHAGMKAEMQGRASSKVRDFALYGETTGETDEFGLPVRYNWAAEYRGSAMVVYGHTPTPEAEWLNRTINIDTGCVFGGKLTALRYPEQALVSVPAAHTYCEPARPFLTETAPVLTAQQQHDDMLDMADVSGKRIITTRLQNNIIIREENAIAALEVMSRFAANPKWLIYLPPTMSPAETSQMGDWLEHPSEAFAYYRHEGVPRVVCEAKHMGSRAIVIVCRDENAARKRFGISGEGIGIVYTRTGRRFFDERAREAEFLAHVQAAVNASGLWDELQTDWLCLDCELLPWSAKAQALLQQQYAAVGAASRAALDAATRQLRMTQARGVEIAPLLASYQERAQLAAQYVAAYRAYCWPVHSVDDLKLAPFHLLASEGAVHIHQNHLWHLEQLRKLCQRDSAHEHGEANERGALLMATSHWVVDVMDEASLQAGIQWWEGLTARGGEGMVVKPLEFIMRGARGLVQPAVKCRGREYLRIIYGPEYTRPENLARLRKRGLSAKRSLAMREFALGVEALERFVRREPLRRVHECVFGVLALESEPVDPRL